MKYKKKMLIKNVLRLFHSSIIIYNSIITNLINSKIISQTNWVNENRRILFNMHHLYILHPMILIISSYFSAYITYFRSNYQSHGGPTVFLFMIFFY